MTRGVQLLLTLATAFSQVGLFLDTPFPRKFVSDDVRIKQDQEPIASDGPNKKFSVIQLVVVHHPNPSFT